MPQAQLKQPYTVVTVTCTHCQQEQVVHTQARGGIWSMAHQFVKCLKCEQKFAVMVPDTIIGGPFPQIGQKMENELHSVISIICPQCGQQQVVHVRFRAGFAQQVSPQAVRCLKCDHQFEVRVPDKILGGPFHP